MLEVLTELTAITDPAANIAIIAMAIFQIKLTINDAKQDVRLTNLERNLK